MSELADSEYDAMVPWETAKDIDDLISWRSEYDDDLVSDTDVPCSPEDEEDDEAAWLRGLPEDVRADYLAGAWTGDGEIEAAGFLHHEREPSGRGFASGGACDTMPPGPDLAKLVAMTTSSGYSKLGESELIGVLCAWQRLISWAQAG